MKNTYSKWPDLSKISFAILPTGSVEQHGKHLPLNTDGIIANALANKLAQNYEDAYLLPLLPFSSSYEHCGFPGSVSLKVATITAMINDIINSLSISRIQKCVIVNGHQGNFFLPNVVQEINKPRQSILLLPSHSIWEKSYMEAGISENISRDMHAGEGETSIILHVAPHLVARNEVEDVDVPYRPFFNVVGIRPYTSTGAIGFPSRASAHKGEMLLNALADNCDNLIKEFLHG